MKLSIDTLAIREKFGDEQALRMIKEAGFDAVDYSMCVVSEQTEMLGDDYIERAYRIKELLAELNLSCNQTHAPFDFQFTDELDKSNIRFLKLTRAIEFTSIIGAENLVIHHVKYGIPEDVDYEVYNLKFYNSLAPYAKEAGIKISVENLYQSIGRTYTYNPMLCDPQKHLEFMKHFDPEVFNICLDIGHSAITGFKPEDAIRAIGKGNIAIMHIHDTDYIKDCHMPPFTERQDWDEIAKALADVEYKGDCSLEIPNFFIRMDKRLIKTALKYAEEAGRILIEKIEENRK